MAFALYVSVDNDTLQLNDGNPFWLESAEGLGGAPPIRFQQRSPLQDGASDFGYRLDARTFVLNLHFYATTDAALDGYRDDLMDAFKPLTDISIFLYIERDDGTTRRLTCHTVDDIQIDLVPEHRPGHLHRATVTLRAASPLWLDPTVVQSSFAGTTSMYWWRAGTAIGSANVMEVTEYPTQGQAWTYTGTITASYSVAFRSPQEPDSGTPTAFHAGTGSVTNDANENEARFMRTPAFGVFGFVSHTGGNTMIPGTQNYILVHDATASNLHRLYYQGTTPFVTALVNRDISTASRRWRSDGSGNASTYWTSEMPQVAVYDVALTQDQRLALDAWMSGTAIVGTATVLNAGDANEYPLIKLRGPLDNPQLVNLATGGTLNLAGLSLGSTDVVTVDLRDGDKKIYDQNGVNQLDSLTNPATLADWHLAPAPIATGGTNSIRVLGGGTVTTNTLVTIEHFNHYLSF